MTSAHAHQMIAALASGASLGSVLASLSESLRNELNADRCAIQRREGDQYLVRAGVVSGEALRQPHETDSVFAQHVWLVPITAPDAQVLGRFVIEGPPIEAPSEEHRAALTTYARLARIAFFEHPPTNTGTSDAMSQLYRSAPWMIQCIDSEVCISDVNETWLQTLGYQRSEVIGRPALDFLTGEGLAKAQAAVAQQAWEGELDDFPMQYRTGDGDTLDVQVTVMIDTADDGTFRAAYACLRNVTGERQADREGRLRRFAMDQSPDAIFLLDRRGAILEVNRTACKRLGYAREELTRMRAADIDPCLRDPYPDWLERLNQPFSIVESVHETRDGERFPVELNKSMVEIDGVDHVCVFARDLRERRAADRERDQQVEARARAEEQLSDRESLLHSLIESMTDPLFVKDLAGRYVLINSADVEALRRPREEIIGRTDQELWPDESFAAQRTDQQVIRTGEAAVFEMEAAYSGKPRRYSIRKYPRRDAQGNITGVIGIARDITEQRRAEQERLALAQRTQQSQKMQALGQLAGGIAHDFNNLLTAILGNAELLLARDTFDSDGDRDAIQQIREAGGRAANLTQQLLAFSRHQISTAVQLDLKETISSTSVLLRHTLGEHIDLKLEVPGETTQIVADKSQIELILMNLMINAADAMPRGGSLVVAVRPVQLPDPRYASFGHLDAGMYLALVVKDNGIGMPPEVRERIFEPFFTTKPRERGTGLGLSTVYSAVQQLQGEIVVESTPGEGSRFTILLPRTQEPPPKAPQTPPNTHTSQGERVLVCEDDRLVREVTCLTLQAAGYLVHPAENGQQALELAAADPSFDLLISDVIMPGINGRQLATEMSRVNQKLRVLFVSGYTDDVLDAQGVQRGGAAFLQKPYEPKALLHRVRSILDASLDHCDRT